MNPLVSVIIPVYNVEKYLDRCIESIVRQTYRNLEIILVDDGSSDNSPQMCDLWALKDNRIKVIHKENSGAGFARNTGLDAAGGKYVLFADSDDYIDLNTVEKCILLARKDKSEIVMYGRTDVTPYGKCVPKPILTDKFLFKNEEIYDDILPGLFINEKGFGVGVCGKMIDLSVIRNNGIRFYSEREVLSEDSLFNIDLFKHIKSVSVLPENYYYYFQNSTSFSRTFKVDFQEMNDRFLKTGIEKSESIHCSEKIIRNIKARYLVYTLAGIKQLVCSSLDKNEKKKQFNRLFNNVILQNTLLRDVLELSSLSAKIFWRFFKMKLYYICYFLIWIKTRK